MPNQAYLYVIDPTLEFPVVVGEIRQAENGSKVLLLNEQAIAQQIEEDEINIVNLTNNDRFHADIQQ